MYNYLEVKCPKREVLSYAQGKIIGLVGIFYRKFFYSKRKKKEFRQVSTFFVLDCGQFNFKTKEKVLKHFTTR